MMRRFPEPAYAGEGGEAAFLPAATAVAAFVDLALAAAPAVAFGSAFLVAVVAFFAADFFAVVGAVSVSADEATPALAEEELFAGAFFLTAAVLDEVATGGCAT